MPKNKVNSPVIVYNDSHLSLKQLSTGVNNIYHMTSRLGVK